MKFIILTLFIIISGCTSFNDTMTPSVSVQKDKFDGSLNLLQPPVSASSSLTEAWHTLGFQWDEKFPNVVFLEVGVSGVTNVMGVAFNVDGEYIKDIDKASVLTKYGDWSTRRLMIPIADFVKISKGKDVKMKVIQIDTYSVSSFGSANYGAVINTKFPPFIKLLQDFNAIPK